MSELLKSIGIHNPAEFYISVGFMFSVIYLVVALLMVVLTNHFFDASLPPKCWANSRRALICSIAASAAILTSFAIMVCYTLSTIPPWCTNILGGSLVILIISSVYFSLLFFQNWKLFRHPISAEENEKIRKAIYGLPVYIIVPLVMCVWKIMDMH